MLYEEKNYDNIFYNSILVKFRIFESKYLSKKVLVDSAWSCCMYLLHT